MDVITDNVGNAAVYPATPRDRRVLYICTRRMRARGIESRGIGADGIGIDTALSIVSICNYVPINNIVNKLATRSTRIPRSDDRY